MEANVLLANQSVPQNTPPSSSGSVELTADRDCRELRAMYRASENATELSILTFIWFGQRKGWFADPVYLSPLAAIVGATERVTDYAVGRLLERRLISTERAIGGGYFLSLNLPAILTAAEARY